MVPNPIGPSAGPWPCLARFTLALVLTGFALPASGQRTDDEWLRDCRDRDERFVFCDVRVERLAARGSLRVDAGPNGGVWIVGEDRSDIEVEARIQTRAATEADAREIGGRIRLSFEGTIRAEGPETGRRESWIAGFVVRVPRRIDLDLETRNGPMSVEAVSGRIEGRTQNGPLSLRDVAGDVRARTQNGPLSIQLTGVRWEGRGLDAETRNGPVTLSIPEGYSAQLETGTTNGPFDTEIPLTVTSLGRMDRRIDSTLGEGGATVRALTTNGPVRIRRR